MNDAASPAGPTQRVWDPLVRIAHWSLAASVLLAWLTRHSAGGWHERLGYAALCVVGVRLLWGWLGSHHARFSSFVRGPRRTLGYAQQMLRGQEDRYVGHNPLGAWMIIALICVIALVGLSGWLYTTEMFWGVAWVEAVHNALSNVLLILIALHVAGVAYASYRHRENLVGAMLHGRKRDP
jgi:cytochrome b